MTARRDRKSTKFATLSIALTALLSCGSGSSLEGSLSDQTSLAFDAVRVEHSPQAVAVIYLRSLPAGGGQDTVLKVVATTTGLDLTKAVSIDLAEPLNGGPAVRGAVTRAVSGDGRSDFPPIVRGKLSFDGPVVAGQHASGHFSATFGQGGSIGQGRTAFGDFSATATEAGQ